MTKVAEFIEEHGDRLEIPGVEWTVNEGIATDLLNRYQEPWRHHHNLAHIGSMAAFLADNDDQLRRPNGLMWSVIGHDAVYVPELTVHKGNERLSAELTAGLLSPYIGGSATLMMIKEDILATASHKWDGKDFDQAFLLDADMSILGSPDEEFDEYDDNIRKEYGFVPEGVFAFNRFKFLQGAAADAAKDALFITDVAHEQFADQAISNLGRAMAKYEALAKDHAKKSS